MNNGWNWAGTWARKVVAAPPLTLVMAPGSNPAGAVAGTSAAGAPAAITWSCRRPQEKLSRKRLNAAAMPTVVPICRNSVRSLVAAPRSLKSTAFWTMIVNTANVGPTPRPATNIHAASISGSVSARSWVMRPMPMISSTRPMRMYGL